MNTAYSQLRTNTYDNLRAKMNSGDNLTFADIENIALYDVALNHCLMSCRMNGLSLNETLIACVFMLADIKRIISEQLAECQSGTGQAIVIVDKDGETLERFKMMAKRDEEKNDHTNGNR